jgi:hypothetical protein
MACCHDPLPRRNPPPPGCVISLVGFGRLTEYHWWVSGASPSGLVHKPSMASTHTTNPGKKRPRPEGPGQKLLDGGETGGCSAVQRHDLNVRRPVWFLSLAKDVESPQPPATIPRGLQNMPFHNPATQLPTPCPLGYFLPLDLAPFRRGSFLGTAQKRAGPGPARQCQPLAGFFCFCCRAAHQGAFGALPPTTWTAQRSRVPSPSSA